MTRSRVRYCQVALLSLASFGLLALGSLACFIKPDTRGLQCSVDAECDGGQICGEKAGVCVKPCPSERPISCGSRESSICCPDDLPYCCEGGCASDAASCNAHLEVSCPDNQPNCSVCDSEGNICPQRTPFCCETPLLDQAPDCNATPRDCAGSLEESG